MHHGQDKNIPSFDAVQYPIRKAVNQTTSYFLGQDRPSSWKIHDPLNCGKSLQLKILAKTRIGVLIVVDRGIKFRLRLRMERKAHPPKRLRTSAATCSPGMG